MPFCIQYQQQSKHLVKSRSNHVCDFTKCLDCCWYWMQKGMHQNEKNTGQDCSNKEKPPSQKKKHRCTEDREDSFGQRVLELALAFGIERGAKNAHPHQSKDTYQEQTHWTCQCRGDHEAQKDCCVVGSEVLQVCLQALPRVGLRLRHCFEVGPRLQMRNPTFASSLKRLQRLERL